MKTRLIVFLVSAFCLVILPLAANAQVKLTWQVVKYDLACELPGNFGGNRDLDVTATLLLKNQTDRAYDRVTLRLNEAAKVDSVAANGAPADFRSGSEKLSASQNVQKLQVSIPDIGAGASVSVVVKYKLEVSANSGLIALSPAGSQFLPLSFWYPTPTSWYFPEGADNAPVDVSVKGLGSRTLVAAGESKNGRFSSSLKGMPFFAAGKWNESEHGGISVYAPVSGDVVATRAGEMALVASEAKVFVESIFGRKINTPIRIVAVSRGSGFSGGGTIFVERGSFMTRSLDSKTVGSISEAIAKTMIGNVIEVRGAGYGVIAEGLSRFISNRFIEEKYGPAIAEKIKLRQISNYVAIADKDGPLNAVTPVDGYYYSSTGNKGAMIWSFLHNKYKDDFFSILKASSADNELTLQELRSAFNGQKAYLDYSLDQVTGMNLMVGNPQSSAGASKCALRNLGEIDADVLVVGYDKSGKRFSQQVVIPAKGFAEARFETGGIVSVEVDPDKFYPQLSLKDDFAPRTIEDDDPLVFIKREFDRQRFQDAEKNARSVLSRYPEFDEASVFLGRSLLALGKFTDAKVEFEKVLASKLSSPQSIAWALVGLADAEKTTGQAERAVRLYNEAIRADAEYGATLAARKGRAETGIKTEKPAAVSAFFAEFDKAVVANSKSAVESLIMNGEIARFSSNVAGQAQSWQTEIMAVDQIDEETWLVETNLSLKLLNRENEGGLAVFRLTSVDGNLKLSGVEVFEVS